MFCSLMYASSGLINKEFEFEYCMLQVTGLSAVIRQKLHVLDNFSVSVNNKILTYTFSERLPQERLKIIRKIREILKKNRNNTP